MVGFQDGADNGKADSRSQASAALMLAALVSLPDKGAVLFRNGRSGIGNGNPAAVGRDSDTSAVCGMVDGIIQKISDYLIEQAAKRKFGEFTPNTIDDSLVEKARASAASRPR